MTVLRRKLLLLLLLVSACLVLLLYSSEDGWMRGQSEEEREWAGEEEEEEEDSEEEPGLSEEFVDVWGSFDPNEVRHERDIFLISTSGDGSLEPRQGCVVEAAARHHPHRTVFVLLTGGNVSSIDVLASSVTRTLLFVPNVRLRHLAVTETFRYTKLWQWYVHSDWHLEPDRDSTLALALGALLLYKHGGFLLSWDALVIAPLPFPVLGQCGPDSLATHILGLPAHSPLTERLLEQAQLSLKPSDISLASLDHQLRQECRVDSLVSLRYRQCGQLPSLLPPQALCPLEREKHWVLFDPRRARIARRQVEQEGTLVVCLWLTESQGLAKWAGTDFPSEMKRLGELHCPTLLDMNKNLL